MATFSTIYTEVAEKLHDTGSSMITRVKEWVNFTQQDVATSAFWPWLLKEQQIVLSAQITTGTATVTNDSTTVDFSSTVVPASITTGQWYFQAGTDNEWYIVDSRTDSDTIELLQKYQGTTSATATYKLQRMVYSLPSDTYAVASLRQADSPVKLRWMSYQYLDQIDPANDSTDDPYAYIPMGMDPNGYPQVMFYPPEESATVFNLRYYRQLTDLSADGDVSLIPAADHEILIYGALARGFEYLDDDQNEQKNMMKYERRLKKMKNRYLSGPDQAIVIGSNQFPVTGDIDLRFLQLPVTV